MTITCPHCNFSREIDDSRIPAGTARVACPRCKEKFSFSKEETFELFTATAVEPSVSPAPVVLPTPAAATPVYGDSYGNNAAAPTAADLPKAGFWIRAAASIVDSILLSIAQMILGLVLGFSIGYATGGLSDDGNTALLIASWLFGALLSVAYYVTFTGYNGQTPGKMMVRIKVIRTDGAAISYGKAALRETIGKFISAIILCIGYLMVAFDAQKQGLHDKIADTYVVKI